MVCVATPLPFFVRSSQPAAFAAGATSNTFCSGKLPPSGKTFPALPGPLPASSPPVASRMRDDHDGDRQHRCGAVADHLLALLGGTRLLLALLALEA